MNNIEFRKHAHEIVDWIADYFEDLENMQVKPGIEPGQILGQIPESAPARAEKFENIFSDFLNIILPGMTHWQHPRFHAYFPANNSYPSLLGEMLTAAMGAQCMIWQTSPAASELEEVVMNWLRDMTGLPPEFHGVIQDTASTATLVSILTVREKFTNYGINKAGYPGGNRYRVYCSTEAHSSIEKAAKIAGLGKNNVVKVPVDDKFSIIPSELEKAIDDDFKKGYRPLCIIAALGTTGSTAVDDLTEAGKIADKFGLWVHVDAAFAGTAMLLPEMRHYLEGIEYVDSYVFNPHKWMFTNFDCSAYFVRDKDALIRTFEIMPEYLKTEVDTQVNNYRDWGLQLGRRFRALKLWFVIRSFGVEGLRAKVREHIDMAHKLKDLINADPEFEMLAPLNFNTLCFRYNPGDRDETELNVLNARLLENVNKTGRAFITHTKLNGRYTIRFVIGQTNVRWHHVKETWNIIRATRP